MLLQGRREGENGRDGDCRPERSVTSKGLLAEELMARHYGQYIFSLGERYFSFRYRGRE